MPNWWNRLTGANAPAERKAIPLHSLVSWNELDPNWTRRGFVSLCSEGFQKNPVVYRCVRLIAEAATRVPLRVSDGGKEASEHPLLALFQPLLSQWRSASQKGAKAISNLLKSTTLPENDTLRDLTHKYFQAYLSEGFSYLANCPLNWERYFPPKA